MRRAATAATAAMLCLAAQACTGDDGGGPTATATGTPATGQPEETNTVKSYPELPDCAAITKLYPKGIYRSVGPYPGDTGKPEEDLQYRYCNTSGYAAGDGKAQLTTVVTIYRPTADPFRGIPLSTWLPQRTGELIAERCAGASQESWGAGGKRCTTGQNQAVVAGAGGGAVVRVEVGGALPRTQVESAADRIGRAVVSDLG